MRSFVFLGLLASASVLPAGAAVQAQSTDAVAPGLSIAAAGQRAAGMSMRGGHGFRGGTHFRGGGTHVVRGGHQFRGGTHVRGGHQFRGGHRFGGGTHFRSGGNFRGGHRFDRGSRFFVGGFLPTFFLAPRYFVTNYPAFGLARPARGYRWVRYYDDAYLVDDRGYISDYRYGVPFDGDYYYDDSGYRDGYYDDRYGGYDERYYCETGYRRGGGGGAAAGAIAGGVLGGVAGNLIAERGDRTEGTIIGAGLGAIAGGAIGAAAERHRYDRERDCYYLDDDYYREDVEYRYDDRVPEYVGDGDYYYDREVRVAHDFDHAPPRRYHPPRPMPYPQPVRTEVYVGGGVPRVTTHATGGIAQNATTTIVLGNSAPAVTTTVVEEEYEYYTPQRSYRTKRLRR